MAIKTIAQLKAYFRKGLYPTESQFADMLDSYRHKSEKVDLAQVEGLAEALNSKYNTSEAKIIEAKQKQQEADIDWLKTVQEKQADEIDELQDSDEAQQAELETINGELAKVRELIKSGATLDQARIALLGLGQKYSTLYSLASTVKTFLEATDTKDKTINTWVEVENFLQGITDTESLTALLKELEDKVTEAYTQAIAEALEKSEDLIKVEYDELVALRDNQLLVPGKLYRITDYYATVANDPEARSVYHPFDIVVLALSPDTLSEEAMAMLSESDRDGYFGYWTHLESWKIWYSLDNDVLRFQWADVDNGHGVIYRMIDEKGNDCPYDFKGIQFKRYLTEGEFLNNILDRYPNPKPTRYLFCDGMDGLGGCKPDAKSFAWFYTFSYITGQDPITAMDASSLRFINQDLDVNSYGRGCDSNHIEPYHICTDTDGLKRVVQALNNIVVSSDDTYTGESVGIFTNHWEADCYNMTFHEHCRQNSFGQGCHNIAAYKFNRNTLGRLCENNIFGWSEDNTIGDLFSENQAENMFMANTIGKACRSNYFGYGFQVNTLGVLCERNRFGANCEQNRFGEGCQDNQLGDDCTSNIFGAECTGNRLDWKNHYNTFGNRCNDNVIGYSSNRNKIGDEGSYNSIGSECNDNTLGDQCDHNRLITECNYNSLGDRCRYNEIRNYCCNNILCNDCLSNTFNHVCDYNVLGDNCTSNKLGTECRRNRFIARCSSNTLKPGCLQNSLGYCASYNELGERCVENTLGNFCNHNKLKAYCCENIFEPNVAYVEVKWDDTRNVHILNGTKGTEDNPLVLSFVTGHLATQYAGMTSSGIFRIWYPADLAPE